jgi:hypothetical protein
MTLMTLCQNGHPSNKPYLSHNRPTAAVHTGAFMLTGPKEEEEEEEEETIPTSS